MEFAVKVDVHHHHDEIISRKLDDLLARTKKGFAVVDTATTAIGEQIEKLIAAANLNPEEKAVFAEIVTKLKALGKDTESPS